MGGLPAVSSRGPGTVVHILGSNDHGEAAAMAAEEAINSALVHEIGVYEDGSENPER